MCHITLYIILFAARLAYVIPCGTNVHFNSQPGSQCKGIIYIYLTRVCLHLQMVLVETRCYKAGITI